MFDTKVEKWCHLCRGRMPILRPSSLFLQKILDTHRNKNKFPTRIWDDDPPPAPNLTTPLSAALDGGADAPALTLGHPLLRALDSCGPGSTPQFDRVQAQLIISGLLDHPLAAGRAVKKLCSSPASVPRAVALFARLGHPDAFIANTILRAHLASVGPDEALGFYRRHVLTAGVRPNHYTFPLLAKLFAELGLAGEGLTTHAHISKLGFESDLFVRNSLIHMYSSLSEIGAARRLFDYSPVSDVVTWNSIVDGYIKNGMVGAARQLFDEMPEREVTSWNVMIAGHAAVGEMEAAKDLFLMMPERDAVSWSTLIDGYAKVGEAALARELFDAMPYRNTVSWNTMLALYARTKAYRECLKLFDDMVAVGDVKPNEATFVSVLTACANLGQLDKGKWVHSLIKDSNARIEPDVLLLTALLTMYAKCGVMDSATEVFDQMVERSVVSWNSMIVGYGLHGHGDKALELFLEMEEMGPRPNETTFVCLLSACTHGGMVLEGWWCFDRMNRVYGIEPKAEHLGCVVDLLGRAGLLRDSGEIIKSMPVQQGPTLWGALLSACRTHSEWELGEAVGRKLIEMEPSDIGPYVLLSNIYAAGGRWDEVEKVRELMRKNGLQKGAGVSSVGFGSDPHLSGEGGRSVGRKSMVYSMLREVGTQLKLSCREFDGRRETSESDGGSPLATPLPQRRTVSYANEW